MCFSYLGDSCPKCGASKIPHNYTSDSGATKVASFNLCLQFLAVKLFMWKGKVSLGSLSTYLGLNYQADRAFLTEAGFLNDQLHLSLFLCKMGKTKQNKIQIYSEDNCWSLTANQQLPVFCQSFCLLNGSLKPWKTMLFSTWSELFLKILNVNR